MFSIERPGIDPKWERGWKTIQRNGIQWIDARGPKNILQLEEYVHDGIVQEEQDFLQKSPNPLVEPPFMKWESSYLRSSLSVYGLMRVFEFEMKGMAGEWDSALAIRAFAARYTAQTASLYAAHQFPNRFNGRLLQAGLSTGDVLFTALGIVIGCKEEAIRLARMQLAAYKAGYFLGDKRYYPIFTFMLRILANYLEDQPLVLEGEPLAEPIMQALFDLWRVSDPNALVNVCLAACDYHTQRCKTGNAKNFYEFENREWTRTPIEILLLFKLRQLIGLQNPHLDHPLMNTALGVLPEEMAFQPDDLILRVRARMQQDGYNEGKVYEFVCGTSA